MFLNPVLENSSNNQTSQPKKLPKWVKDEFEIE